MRRISALLLPLPVLGLLAFATYGAFGAAKASAAPHIMVIVEENVAYSHADGTPYIIGNSSAPYLNALANDGWASATNWFSAQHVSPYSYRELIAGKSEMGVKKPFKDPTLVDELAAAGFSWKAYMESAPGSNCKGDATSAPNYDPGHNPFFQFSSIINTPAQCNQVVPYSLSTMGSDLNSSSPPDFVWITPNQCDNMHSKCTSNPVQQGDTWLANNLPTVFRSSWFGAGGIVIITWDESVNKDTSGGSLGTGGHIATMVVSTTNFHLGGFAFTTPGDHYGVLRAIEEAYGVGQLGNSANPAFGDLSGAF